MFKNKFYTLIATGLFVGKIPFAPGTFGSVLGVLIWVLINQIFFPSLLIWGLIIAVLTLIGIRAADFYCEKHKKEDAKEVVIDEICGQLLAFLIAEYFLTNLNYLSLFLGFVLFRIFDIKKPLLIGSLDKKVKGGLGVMLDDLLAGICAGVLLLIINLVLPVALS